MKNQFGGCWYWMLVCGMLVDLFCLIFKSFHIRSQQGRMIYDCQGSKHQQTICPVTNIAGIIRKLSLATVLKRHCPLLAQRIPHFLLGVPVYFKFDSMNIVFEWFTGSCLHKNTPSATRVKQIRMQMYK